MDIVAVSPSSIWRGLAKERYPEARPLIISNNGPQFVAKNFKGFLRISGMTHVRTSPHYPQSNGKRKRFHATIKKEWLRPGGVPLSLDEARSIVKKSIAHYNNVRLHSIINYATPMNQLNGREREIFKERDRKLEETREQRRKNF